MAKRKPPNYPPPVRFRSYWEGLADEARTELASKLGISPAYLYQLSIGFRRASAILAQRLEQETGISRAEFRPDIYGAPSVAYRYRAQVNA